MSDEQKTVSNELNNLVIKMSSGRMYTVLFLRTLRPEACNINEVAALQGAITHLFAIIECDRMALDAETARADAAEKERENYKMRCDSYNDRIDLECDKRRIESERVKELELALLWFGVHRMGCYYQLLGNEAGQDMSKCSCGIGAALAGKEATDETQ